jgi:hypothetical protein
MKKLTNEDIKRIEEMDLLMGNVARTGKTNWETNCKAEVVGNKVKVTTWGDDEREITEMYDILDLKDEEYIKLEAMTGEIVFLC